MKQILKYVFILLIIISLQTACEKDGIQNVKKDMDLILELNNKASNVITIDSHTYFLDAYLWRDFMPISPPNGKSLVSINWLISSDSISIPVNFEMKQQYVIYNDSIWIADYENEKHSSPAYKIEKVSRNGPKWGPNIYVDIVAKILDTKTNQDYFLKRSKVYIIRTD